MLIIYMIPYMVLGSLIGTIVMFMGVLRVSFLAMLLLTGDFDRFKSEQTEGLSLVIEKLKRAYAKVLGFFK